MPSVNRKKMMAQVKRVVVKVGSGVLTRRNGLNLNVIDDLSTEMSALRSKGIELILVSSGAIAGGLRKAGLTKRPVSVSEQQALAAMGQSRLIQAYEDAFGRHGGTVAQLLLTRDDLTHRRRYLNARNTLRTLLAWRVIPIVNENDTVGTDEIKFGDNDNLAALVTTLTEADLLINLTDIDGLYDKDPREHADATLIPMVTKIDRRITRMAGAIPGFLGTGGMGSKITAARKVAMGGAPTVIANGLRPHVIKDIYAGRRVGTLFLSNDVSLSRRKHWIAFTKAPKGELTIDAGAETALLRNGKSLLPSGIQAVAGRFSMGDAVELKDAAGRRLAVGMVNYHSGDLKKIIGARTAEIEGLLGFKHDDEIIHRDNMILATELEEE
ncbi:MAG: glutamate 5-kinase [Desulfosarcinaceae bacterium]|nr:glutamate 5-kinase [Desulfosarcinaceae bacterium]